MEKRGTEMNEKQKKVLISFILIILIAAAAASIAILVLGYINKDEMMKLAGTISTFISPSMLIGVFIKILVNKTHQKKIETTLSNAGLQNIDVKKNELKNALEITEIGKFKFIEKEGTIIIKIPAPVLKDLNLVKELQNDFSYFIARKRDEINYNITHK